MGVGRVSSSIAGYINRSKGAQKMFRVIADNSALFSTVAAVAVGTTIRPALTIGVSKNKRDGVYSAASSIASSVMELIGGILMITPMKKGINKSAGELFVKKGTIYFQNKELLRNYKSVAQRVYQLFTYPVTSAVRFAMVAPIAIALNKMGIAKSAGLDGKK